MALRDSHIPRARSSRGLTAFDSATHVALFSRLSLSCSVSLVTAAYVREVANGAYAVMRGDESLSTHASRDEALDAAVAVSGFPARDMIFRHDGEPVGELRWLSASTPETVNDGCAIDRASLDEAAASLNASPSPIPVDGGDGSEVHGTSETRGNTAANGWGQYGVVLERADGTPHLMLRAELLPDIASDIDTGRRAFGSVDLGYDKQSTADAQGALRGVTWDSHAITNKPANKRLIPSTVRAASTNGRGRLLASAKRMDMTTNRGSVQRKTIGKAPIADPSAAGISADETVKSREDMLKRAGAPVDSQEVDPDDDAAADSALVTQMQSAIDALKATITQMQAVIDALTAENNTAADSAPDPEKLAMAAVDKAIAEGRISAAHKEKWLRVTRGEGGIDTFETVTAKTRAFPGKSQILRTGEAAPRYDDTAATATRAGYAPGGALDEGDQYVKMMRAAKVSTIGIKRALEKRASAKVKEV